MQENYSRNFVGYSGNFPKVEWPNGGRLAVSFIVNYQEGAESSRVDGDPTSESYGTDIPGIRQLSNARHHICESVFEYGSSNGIWRLLKLFDDYSVPLTLFACGKALERNIPLAQSLAKWPHEIAGHGYRWIDYRVVSPAIEKNHIRKTFEVIQKLTNKSIVGWKTGRHSENTRGIIQSMGLLYDSDDYSGELPYYVQDSGNSHLVIPSSLVTSDFRYSSSPGWSSPDDCYSNLKSAFDCLYREGASSPKILTVTLHSRLSGQPGRAEAIKRFLDLIHQYDDIWICQRSDIAKHWLKYHPPECSVVVDGAGTKTTTSKRETEALA